jgi:Domain of unknown function (DUF5667)
LCGEEVGSMIIELFSRRRAERFAQLLDQAEGGRGRHSRSPLDEELAGAVVIAQRLGGAGRADLSEAEPAEAGLTEADRGKTDLRAAAARLVHQTRPTPAFRTDLRAMLVAAAERGTAAERQTADDQTPAGRRPAGVAPAQRRPAGGRVYADTSPGTVTGRPKAAGPGTRRRTRAAILVGIAAGALALSGMSMASGDALPGDPLYAVKRSTESAQLVLAGSDVDRGQAYLGFARTRGREAAATRTVPGRLIPVLTELDQQTTTGVRLLTSAAVARHDAGPLDAVDAFVAAQRPVVAGLLDTRDQRDRSRAQQSLDLLNRVSDRVRVLRDALACPADGRSDALGPLPAAC